MENVAENMFYHFVGQIQLPETASNLERVHGYIFCGMLFSTCILFVPCRPMRKEKKANEPNNATENQQLRFSSLDSLLCRADLYLMTAIV